MKILKFLSPATLAMLAAVVISSFSLSSCKKDDEPAPSNTKTIVQIAEGTSNLSTLVSALKKYPDLVTTLSSSGKYTVFAPTNDAFVALLQAIGQTSIDDVPEDVLKSILQYHVVGNASVMSKDLKAGKVKTVQGEDITVTVSPIVLNGSTKVVTADVEASNGVIHVVDGVLIQPTVQPIVGTIVAPAYFNKNFTTLIAAVKAASPGILTTLLGNGPSNEGLTLFAPTNAAFEAAGITSLPDQATLDAVLTYHVVDGTVKSADLPTGSAAIMTLNGNFYLSNYDDGVSINGTTKVTAVDIEASNGVVHVIDRTLMPPSKTIKEIAVAMSAASSPEFTQLVAALSRTSGTPTDLLAAVSNADASLTVFAPTDAAFQALYTALGVAGVNDIPLGTLTKVLMHHVVGARVFSTDLMDGSVQTLNGSVTINAAAGTITDGKGEVAKLSSNAALLNVLATNGIIHTIDKVLLPE